MPVDPKHCGQFGRYELIRRISIGGMAEVFKAKSYTEAGFEKVVALKRLLPSMAQEQGFVDMLIQEAQVAAELEHPSICPIYELGRVEDAYYLTMEFIYGHDLRGMLKRLKKTGHPSDPWLVAYVAYQIADALDYAWERARRGDQPLRLVHRDISPPNVMIGFDGAVKVIDFGIAKFANSSVQTGAGVLKGKYAYMSPEHAGRRPLDQRSDIWSLGVVLHELLNQRRLFVGSSTADTIDQVLHREVPRLEGVPPALADIVQRMLDRDLDARFGTHAEVLTELGAFLATAPSAASNRELSGWMDRLFPEDQRIESDLTDDEVALLFSAEERGDLTTDMRSDISQATQIFLMDETGQAEYREVLQALIDRGMVHTVHTAQSPLVEATSSAVEQGANWVERLWVAACGVGVVALVLSAL